MTLEPPWSPTYGRCLRRLLGALLLASLTACSSRGTPPTVALTRPDEACLQEAEPLPELTDPSLAGMVRNHVEVADLYHQLSARHSCLVRFERGRR